MPPASTSAPPLAATTRSWLLPGSRWRTAGDAAFPPWRLAPATPPALHRTAPYLSPRSKACLSSPTATAIFSLAHIDFSRRIVRDGRKGIQQAGRPSRPGAGIEGDGVETRNFVRGRVFLVKLPSP